MPARNLRRLIIAIAAAAAALTFVATPNLHSQSAAAPPPVAAAGLRIGGDVSTPLVLSIADLKKMPRKNLTVVNPHTQKSEVYEGVLLEELLRRAGVAQGEKLRGTAMATYVVAEGSDGYRVIFSLAELDSGMIDSDVIVADTLDGAAIGVDVGPLRIVAPHEKRPARWVRMLSAITVVHPPK